MLGDILLGLGTSYIKQRILIYIMFVKTYRYKIRKNDFQKWKKNNDIVTKLYKKYGGDFNSRLFLEQLTYFEDIDSVDAMLLRNQDLTKEVIFNFLAKEIRNIKLSL